MIRKKEIQDKAIAWGVKPEIVDKDYVLGHLLASFNLHLGKQLIFKGGTCLRKCYFPTYRFSEDLDFSSIAPDFELTSTMIHEICGKVTSHTGILFNPGDIELMLHHDIKKGYRVRIKYWGAHHDKNEPPPPSDRWKTTIKIEISTEEIILLIAELKPIHHPYSDSLISEEPIACYSLDEVLAEKLRALEQRSYTAPRDYFDIYNLTQDFKTSDWLRIKPLFLQKMSYKEIEYGGPNQLVEPESIERVCKAWNASLAYQMDQNLDITAEEIIETVKYRILENL
jgi:predicted nucleotidyltransferase component of viral defense system